MAVVLAYDRASSGMRMLTIWTTGRGWPGWTQHFNRVDVAPLPVVYPLSGTQYESIHGLIWHLHPLGLESGVRSDHLGPPTSGDTDESGSAQDCDGPMSGPD